LGALFPLIVLAELVALIVVLAPDASDQSLLARLGPACLFTFWVALLCAAGLCLLKSPLRRAGPARGGIAALLLVLAISWSCAAAALVLAPVLDFESLAPIGFQWRVASLSLLVAAAALRYGYIHEQWKQQVHAKARAELEALQARIRPHFLFNTLNAIASLIRSAPERAEEAVLDLSDLLRAALKAGSSLIPLVEELELTQRYLAIEKLRLGSRLQIELRLDGLPGNLKLPPLCLQPLVENAVVHGIQLLPAGGCVEIWWEMPPDQASIRVCIRNPCPVESTAKPTGHGIAIDNVRARLKSALGPTANLHIQRSAGQFVACIELPRVTV
jgi:two-component system sensor histidine kinase AlgZ